MHLGVKFENKLVLLITQHKSNPAQHLFQRYTNMPSSGAKNACIYSFFIYSNKVRPFVYMHLNEKYLILRLCIFNKDRKYFLISFKVRKKIKYYQKH